MKLLIQFPTRQRPRQFISRLFDYIDYLEDKENYMVHVSCDIDDVTMNNDKIKSLVSSFPNTEISFNDNKTKIQAFNAGVTERKFEIILCASDDMKPMIKGYDNIIRRRFINNFPNGDGVLHFNDGYSGISINTLSIMDRIYYNRFNYIYNPAYKSFFCDKEFDDISIRLNKKVYIDQVIIKHEHPYNYKEVKFDDLYEKNKRDFQADHKLYESRKGW